MLFCIGSLKMQMLGTGNADTLTDSVKDCNVKITEIIWTEIKIK